MVPQPFRKRDLLEGWVRVSARCSKQAAPGQAQVDWILATITTKGVLIPRPWVDHPYGEEEITLLEEELLPAMAVFLARVDAIDRAIEADQEAEVQALEASSAASARLGQGRPLAGHFCCFRLPGMPIALESSF